MTPARLGPMFALLFCAVGCTRLFGQPLRAFLREQLGLAADETALVVALVMLTDTLRPALALAVDVSAGRGVEPRTWVRVAAAVAIVAALASTLSGAPAMLLWVGIALASAVVVELVASAAIAGEQARGTTTALLGPARTFVMTGVTVVASIAAGWSAQAPARRLGLLVAAMMAVALLVSRRLPRWERAAARRRVAPSRTALAAAVFAFAFYIVPGFSTLLYIERHEVLGFSQLAIGGLEALNNLAGLAGLLAYRMLRARVELPVMLPAAIAAYALSPAGYLVYTHGWVAPAVEIVNGALSIVGLAAVSETILRGAGSEGDALPTAIILCAAHTAVALSDPLGSSLETAGLSFAGVVVLHIGCYGVVAMVVARLRRRLDWL